MTSNISDDKYSSKNRQQSVEDSASLMWNSFSAIPDLETRQHVLNHHIKSINVQDKIDAEHANYDTFLNIAKRKNEVELGREATQRKKDALAKSVLIDDSCNSQSSTSSCEICNLDELRCLCNVTFTNADSNETLEWKAKKDGGLKNQSMIFVSTTSNQGNHELQYEILGTCQHGKEDCCKLFYKKFDTNNDDSELIKIETQKSQLTLIFDAMQELQQNEANLAQEIYTVNLSKKGEIGDLEKRKISEFIFGKQSFTQAMSSLPQVLKRTLDFSVFSNISYMPVTVYGIHVLECKDESDIAVQFKLDLPVTAFPFTRPYTVCYLLPEYSVDYEVSIDFNDAADIPESAKDKINQSYSKQLGCKLSGKLTESFGGQKNLNLTGEADLKSIISLIVGRNTDQKNSAKKTDESKDSSVKIFQYINEILEYTKKMDIFSKYGSVLPKIGFYYPKLDFSGTATLSSKKLQAGSSEKTSFYIKREKNLIKANPLFGAFIEFNLINVFKAVGGPFGQFIARISDVNVKAVHWKLEATLTTSLLIKGELEVLSSEVNAIDSIVPKKLSGVGELKLEAKAELGVEAIIFYATFNASFKLIGSLEFAMVRTEKGELGWYFGTTGIAFYWQIVIVFGLGGEKKNNDEITEDSNKKYLQAGVESSKFGNDVSTAQEPEVWTKESVTDAMNKNQDRLDIAQREDTEWRSKVNYATEFSIEDYQASEQARQEYQSSVDEMRRLKNINRSIDEISTTKANSNQNISERLIELTNQQKTVGLTEAENSERLRLRNQVNKIRLGYDAPNDPRELLDADVEIELYQKRLRELDTLLNTTYTEKAIEERIGMGALLGKDPIGDQKKFIDQRQQYVDEQKALQGDKDKHDKVILCEASIFKTSDNLTSQDKKNARESLASAND